MVTNQPSLVHMVQFRGSQRLIGQKMDMYFRVRIVEIATTDEPPKIVWDVEPETPSNESEPCSILNMSTS